MTKVSNTTFSIGVKTSSDTTYSSSGTVQKCQVSACQVVVTDAAHGLANNDNVYITGVGGMTNLNNTVWTVASATTNTYVASSTFGPSYQRLHERWRVMVHQARLLLLLFPELVGRELAVHGERLRERAHRHACL